MKSFTTSGLVFRLEDYTKFHVHEKLRSNLYHDSSSLHKHKWLELNRKLKECIVYV